MIVALLCTSCLLLGQVSATGGAGPSAELTRQVKRLIEQLDSDQAAERDAAQTKLLELGVPALPLLPNPSKKYSAEVNKQLSAIRLVLQTKHAKDSVLPTKVTLRGSMTLKEALQKVQEQTGNVLVDAREQLGQELLDPEVKPELAGATFWEALDWFMDDAKLVPYPYLEIGKLGYQNRPPSMNPIKGRVAYLGAFRCEPGEFLLKRDLRDNRDPLGLLKLELSWEPRLKIVAIYFDSSQFEIKDNQGNDLVLPAQETEAEAEIPVSQGTPNVELDLPMLAPIRGSTALATVKGKLRAVVLGQAQDFTFEELKPGKTQEQRYGGVTVTLSQVLKSNDSIWDLGVIVKFNETSGALQSHRTWVGENEVVLLNPKGEPVPLAGSEEFHRTDDATGTTYQFEVEDMNLTGYRLVYRTPVIIINHPLELELKELPLP